MQTINFNEFPVLTTQTLTLRQLSVNDKQEIFTIRTDVEVNKYLNRKKCNAIDDAINFIDLVNQNVLINKSLYWAITITNTKTFVGTISLNEFSADISKAEIGFELLTNFQGKGIMNEASKAVILHTFKTLKLKKIEAFAHCNNIKSINILEKLLFKKTENSENENSELLMFTLINPIYV
jgi:[ribosomal protein S5]-alanine N-acetyltransferase